MSELLNKIYQGSPDFQSSIVSKVRVNREYLLSSHVADELNTYRMWEPFPVINDAYEFEYDENNKWKEVVKTLPGAPGVRSIFNRSGAVMLGTGNNDIYEASSWRISNNVPLVDNPSNRKRIKDISKCTIKDLVEDSSKGLLGRETYSYSDFMYCKYLGKVPNNYMITLRRFPLPVDDYIASVGENEGERKRFSSANSVSTGCMVTWMGTPGNEMSNILKYSFKMPFKWQTSSNDLSVEGSGDDMTNPLNSIAAAFDPTYRKHYMKGEVGNAFNAYVGNFFKAGSNPYNLEQLNNWRDGNKVYGPVDTIKGTYMRDDQAGLEFDQKISLQFDYELRSYNGINPRQAMLDLISNILNVTYNTGTFFGGGYRGVGVGQNNIFANMNIFKADGGLSSFYDAFVKDFSTITGAVRSKIPTSFDGWKNLIANALNTLGGMFLGGLLNRLGRPQKIYATSLLSPAPIGFWHLTIGNPHHPIMSLGNMILTNTTIEHYGPLGIDDFPTGLRVTCELERGKPRDIRDIEKIYMHGNDRIYSSMAGEIKTMYEHSKLYKNKGGKKTTIKSVDSTEIKDSTNESQTNYDIADLKSMEEVWMKYFGTSDEQSIIITAKEQENGSQKKKLNT